MKVFCWCFCLSLHCLTRKWTRTRSAVLSCLLIRSTSFCLALLLFIFLLLHLRSCLTTLDLLFLHHLLHLRNSGCSFCSVNWTLFLNWKLTLFSSFFQKIIASLIHIYCFLLCCILVVLNSNLHLISLRSLFIQTRWNHSLFLDICVILHYLQTLLNIN